MGKSSNPLFGSDKGSGEYNQFKDQIQKACKCSYKTRIIGYVACFAVGWILSFIASFVYIFKHTVDVFAIFFSIGQIINITGSCFLATPVTQIKDMLKKARIWFSIAYVLSAITTLVLAITLPSNLRGLVFLTLIIQIVSYFFYTLSYIPYGQKILGKVLKVMLQ